MKGLADEKRTDENLPPPNTAGQAQGGRGRVLRAVAVIAVLGVFAAPRFLSIEDVNVDPTVQSYWDAMASGKATVRDCPGLNHPSHGKHGKHKNGWITPKAAEQIYVKVPSNDSVAAASKRYTEHAHPAGSGWDFVTALQVKNDWERELGLKVTGVDVNLFDAGDSEARDLILNPQAKPAVWTETFYPLLNTPVRSSVTLLSDPPFHAKLRETQVDGDADSDQADEVPVFHGFSVSGDVTGKFIYAGYGLKSDFDLLQAKGVDFTGKIALVKYGRNFRGLKVKAAQEAGAIACIIFTDPGDDGEITEANGHKAYPEGPARVPSSVQRGSVQFLSMYPGDPTTPGEPAYKNATRVEPTNIPSIPSIPISFEDAVEILKTLKGKGLKAADVDASFEGGLGHYGVEYWTGPGDLDIHFVNEVNTRIMPIWNTMAVIPGHIHDEVIFVGNHRDAWVLGGADPNSGTASQYELVRGLGALLKKGWKPLRTIVLASWDGEEYGLVGSTEFAEGVPEWLSNNVVSYHNLDSSASGPNFHGAASPSLALLLRSIAEEVQKPDARSVWDARFDGGMAAEDELEPKGSGIAPLGSGSDYTAFLMRYGVAATDFSFGGGPSAPVYHYHSVLDSHAWQKKYGDPEFQKHKEAAQIIGLLALRLADSPILPLNSTQYARDLGYYLEKVEALASEGGYEIEFDGLRDSIAKLQSASATLDAEREDLLKQLRKVIPRRAWHCFGKPKLPSKAIKVLKQIRVVNTKLKKLESGFISEEGIKEREWYKHKGTSPGKWLGYGATTVSGGGQVLTVVPCADRGAVHRQGRGPRAKGGGRAAGHDRCDGGQADSEGEEGIEERRQMNKLNHALLHIPYITSAGDTSPRS